ncbi:MAG: C-terminal processing protease CtpA/Prc [Gammaproteobacteria bacterium]|jgi:C-terminal processing protease CtpA/Prc
MNEKKQAFNIMKSPIFLIALALLIGISLGFFLQDKPDKVESNTVQNPPVVSSNPPTFESSASDIITLNRLLQDEIKVRQLLTQKLNVLSEQVSELKQNFQSKVRALSDQNERTESLDAELDNNWFNEQALVDSGMTGSQARELKVFFEQQELQQLYMRDQSIREGWDSNKYREEFQTLNDEEDALKNRLGDSVYDAYLYASGQPNRVAVSSVLATAPAGVAGIQAGDHILRYDNQRIYSGFELRHATTGGNASDSVSIEVERDGEVFEVYIVRGPLGIRMNSVSVAP